MVYIRYMSNQYKETHDTWNKIAQPYQDAFMQLDIYNFTYDAFLKALPKQANLLEIGCGPGNITSYLNKKNSSLNILATDVAPAMVEQAQKNNPNIRCKVLDARMINTLQQSFDGIICGFTIPYLNKADVKTFINHSYRLINDEGYFYLSFIPGDYANSGYITGSTGNKVYQYYYLEDTMETWLKQVGFSVFKSYTIEYQREYTTEEHQVIIAKK